jgi:hypothetical protein
MPYDQQGNWISRRQWEQQQYANSPAFAQRRDEATAEKQKREAGYAASGLKMRAAEAAKTPEQRRQAEATNNERLAGMYARAADKTGPSTPPAARPRPGASSSPAGGGGALQTPAQLATAAAEAATKAKTLAGKGSTNVNDPLARNIAASAAALPTAGGGEGMITPAAVNAGVRLTEGELGMRNRDIANAQDKAAALKQQAIDAARNEARAPVAAVNQINAGEALPGFNYKPEQRQQLAKGGAQFDFSTPAAVTDYSAGQYDRLREAEEAARAADQIDEIPLRDNPYTTPTAGEQQAVEELIADAQAAEARSDATTALAKDKNMTPAQFQAKKAADAAEAEQREFELAMTMAANAQKAGLTEAQGLARLGAGWNSINDEIKPIQEWLAEVKHQGKRYADERKKKQNQLEQLIKQREAIKARFFKGLDLNTPAAAEDETDQ